MKQHIRPAIAGTIAFSALLLAAPVEAQPARPWSQRFADAVMQRNAMVHAEWDYTAGVVLTAIDRVGVKTSDPRYRAYVKSNIDAFVQPDGTIKTYTLDEFNLDQINEGKLLFAFHQSTGDARYRKAADLLREQLRRQPRTSEGGYWHKQIYPHQMWLDGLYMAAPFLAQYGATFGDTAAANDAARQLLLIARHTRDPKTGLFYHGWDESKTQIWADKETGLSPNFWGRAVGWYAMAIVDVLDHLPAAHPDRPQIVRILNDLADAVAKVQDPVTGLWYEVLDQPNRKGNYHEASGSSMFVYALAKGARKGWLPAQYRDVARRGHDGLVRHMITIDAAGLPSLNGIVSVAGLGGKQQRDGSFEYYVSEPVVANDYKGVGPFIMASLELGR
jgi:unsaturated rhamnogalacturonyl hydrolase